MENIVTASIHFSFKGKRHSPSITLELDKHLQASGELPNFYPLIAKENNFDLYSYEYEMMQAEEIRFSEAQGLVKNFIHNGVLDSASFIAAFHNEKIINELKMISEKNMDIRDLSAHPKLKQALIEAYQLGEKSRH